METHTAEYQTPQDRAYTTRLVNAAPEEARAFLNLKRTAERNNGAIPAKDRELMSVAVALTTQCGYCIEAHINNAVEAGATREEIAETVFIAAALRAVAQWEMDLWQCAFSRKQALPFPEKA